jgi:hypothetical protein
MARSSILTIEGVARPDPSQWGLGREKFRSTLGARPPRLGRSPCRHRRACLGGLGLHGPTWSTHHAHQITAIHAHVRVTRAPSQPSSHRPPDDHDRSDRAAAAEQHSVRRRRVLHFSTLIRCRSLSPMPLGDRPAQGFSVGSAAQCMGPGAGSRAEATAGGGESGHVRTTSRA